MLLFNAWFFSVSLWRPSRRSFRPTAGGAAVSLALSTGCSRRGRAHARDFIFDV